MKDKEEEYNKGMRDGFLIGVGLILTIVIVVALTTPY